MGALIIVAIGTAAGTLLAVVAGHYLKLALKRWLRRPHQ
jgi:hypothetical protein